MTVAAASAWSNRYEFSVVDFEQFTIGLLKGAIEAEVPDVMTCIHDAETLVGEVETAYNDFAKETYDGVKDGLYEIGTITTTVATAIKDCSGGVSGIENLINMGKNFSSPLSYAFHVGKDLLVNGIAIYHEIDDAITQYDNSNFNGFGEVFFISRWG